jgi:hypothetical protein
MATTITEIFRDSEMHPDQVKQAEGESGATRVIKNGRGSNPTPPNAGRAALPRSQNCPP